MGCRECRRWIYTSQRVQRRPPPDCTFSFDRVRDVRQTFAGYLHQLAFDPFWRIGQHGNVRQVDHDALLWAAARAPRGATGLIVSLLLRDITARLFDSTTAWRDFVIRLSRLPVHAGLVVELADHAPATRHSRGCFLTSACAMLSAASFVGRCEEQLGGFEHDRRERLLSEPANRGQFAGQFQRIVWSPILL